jgi:MoaA/NifB/PqqE/SkfB family radical SAM enzyme
MFSNSTLITEDVCKDVVKLGNITYFLSIEGTPETNDARRGQGHYDACMRAMDLFKKYGIIFGTSICYTKDNIDAVTSEDFLRFIASKGARYGFYFHLMPVGNNAVPSLMPTPEQRKMIIEKIRYYRSKDCDLEFYPMDFQNDGEYVGGCIAGGRNYFHINSSGDAEPCVFIHFSNSNIHENSILEMLQSPLFMAYHEGQPFNRNQLRPCPMLENPDLLREMVAKTGAHQTNEESPEEVEHLCDKCDEYAKAWAPVADELWAEETHKKPSYENYTKEKRENPDLAAFEHKDGTDEIKLDKDYVKEEF